MRYELIFHEIGDELGKDRINTLTVTGKSLVEILSKFFLAIVQLQSEKHEKEINELTKDDIPF